MIQIKRGHDAETSLAPLIVDSNPDTQIEPAMPDTWYVTFEVQLRGVLPRPRCPRQTMTFETEAEARQFARAVVEEGLTVFA